MSALWAVLGMGAGVYALRLSGLALRDVALPPVWERALRETYRTSWRARTGAAPPCLRFRGFTRDSCA